ncbi:MAG: hypothetical protein OXU21_02390 [Chloroflexota bacterium]|nr:hypothetical protein [Chloroflexota bacterium]
MVAAGGMELSSVHRVPVVLLVALVVGAVAQIACGGDGDVPSPPAESQAAATPTAGLFRTPTPVAARPTTASSGTPVPAATASATPGPTVEPSRAPTPAATVSATAAPSRTPSATAIVSATAAPPQTPTPAATPRALASRLPAVAPLASTAASGSLTPTVALARTPASTSAPQAPASRIPGVVPRTSTATPAPGNPAEECESLAENYAAAHKFYETGTAASSTAWNAYISAHNAGHADPASLSRLQHSYDRLSANLDRSLASMAASKRAADDFEIVHRGRCDLNQVTGKRYRPLPPPKG